MPVQNAFAAVTSTGQVYTWGLDQSGQLGTGATGNPDSPLLTPSLASLPAGVVATTVSVGYNFDLITDTAGTVYAWGENDAGELGIGSTSGTGCNCVATPTRCSSRLRLTSRPSPPEVTTVPR